MLHAMLGHQCINLTCTWMTHAEEVYLKRHFLQTPDSIVLIGKAAKRKIGRTFGNIHQAEMARKCLRAGLYGDPPTNTRGPRDGATTTSLHHYRRTKWPS